jgi:hypothetical protein
MGEERRGEEGEEKRETERERQRERRCDTESWGRTYNGRKEREREGKVEEKCVSGLGSVRWKRPGIWREVKETKHLEWFRRNGDRSSDEMMRGREGRERDGEGGVKGVGKGYLVRGETCHLTSRVQEREKEREGSGEGGRETWREDMRGKGGRIRGGKRERESWEREQEREGEGDGNRERK